MSASTPPKLHGVFRTKLKPRHQRVPNSGTSRNAAPKAHKSGNQNPSSQPFTVVAVDDSAIYRKPVEPSLPPERYAVLFSNNGREALDLFTKDDLLRSFLLGTCRTGEVWNRASAYVATSRTATAISSCLPATSNEELETGC